MELHISIDRWNFWPHLVLDSPRLSVRTLFPDYKVLLWTQLIGAALYASPVLYFFFFFKSNQWFPSLGTWHAKKNVTAAVLSSNVDEMGVYVTRPPRRYEETQLLTWERMSPIPPFLVLRFKTKLTVLFLSCKCHIVILSKSLQCPGTAEAQAPKPLTFYFMCYYCYYVLLVILRLLLLIIIIISWFQENVTLFTTDIISECTHMIWASAWYPHGNFNPANLEQYSSRNP